MHAQFETHGENAKAFSGSKKACGRTGDLMRLVTFATFLPCRSVDVRVEGCICMARD